MRSLAPIIPHLAEGAMFHRTLYLTKVDHRVKVMSDSITSHPGGPDEVFCYNHPSFGRRCNVS